MAPLTPSRRFTLITAAAATLALLLPAHSATPETLPCKYLIPSPTLAADKTVFCVRIDSRKSLTVGVTHDLGRSWRSSRTTGFAASDQLLLNDVVPSPAFATDHQVFVQTADGLYVSTDDGATVSLVDPLAGQYTYFQALVGLRTQANLVPLVSPVVFAQASGNQRPQLLQPPLRIIASGAAGYVDTFLVAPSGTGPYADAVIAVGRALQSGVTPAQWALFGCDGMLTCATSLASLPPGEAVTDVDMAPDFGQSGVIVIRTDPSDGIPRLWLSRDGGRTLRRVSGADAVLRSLARQAEGIVGTRLVADPARKGRLYLRVATTRDVPTVPIETMWRSENDGATWTRIGFSRVTGKPGPVGPRGWPGFGGGDIHGESMLVLRDRILVVGDDERGTGQRVHCSTDGARTWSYFCSR